MRMNKRFANVRSRVVAPAVLLTVIACFVAPVQRGSFGLSAQGVDPTQGRTGSVLYLPVVHQERSEPFELVSDISRARALDAQGDRVYIASGRSVLVLDVADRADERPIGRTGLLPGRAVDIAVDDRLMAVTVEIRRDLQPLAGEIVLFDISDGTAPRRLGALDTLAPPKAITLAGDTLYMVGHATGLWTVDVSEPSDPRDSGRGGRMVGQDIVVEGETAYVVGSQALTVLDVSAPSTPVVLGSIGGLGAPLLRLEVADDRAYIVDAALEGSFNGMRIVDVSDPRAMEHVAEVAMGGIVRQVVVQGGTLYVLSDAANMPFQARVSVYDLADPDRPVALAEIEATSSQQFFEYWDLKVENDRLVVLDVSGATVFDVVESPVPRDGRSVWVGHSIQAIATYGDTAIFATSEAFEVVDLAAPGLPRRLGTLAYGDHSGLSLIRDLAVTDGLAYAVGSVQDSAFVFHPVLVIVDIRDPRRPRRLATLDTVREYQMLGVVGDTAVLATHDSLAIIDLANPEAPTILTQTKLAAEGESFWHMAVDDGRILVASALRSDPRVGQLSTLDLRDRSRPLLGGAARYTGYPFDLAIEGDWAYVSTRCGVNIFDTSEGSPRKAGVEPDCSRHRDLSGPLLPMGDHVLTVMPGGVMREVDVRRPESPRQRSSFRLPEGASKLVRMGRYIFAARTYPADYTTVLRYER